MIRTFFTSYQDRITSMTAIFPPAGWAADSMVSGDWARLGLYVLVSIGSMAVTVWLLG